MTHSADATIRVGLILFGWVGLFFVARFVNNPGFWVATWVAQGFLFEGMSGAAHEAGHCKLYKSRGANTATGWLTSIPRLLNYPAYQLAHMEHHRHTHDPAADSEPHYSVMGLLDYLAYMAFSGISYTIILNWQGVVATLGVGPSWYTTRRHRRLATLGTVVVVVELAAVSLGAWFAPRTLVTFWLIPFLLYNSIIASLVTKPEHFGCGDGPDSSLQTTRTTYSNRLFASLLWNNNLHTAHHLVPSLPGNSLPRLQALIDPHCRHRSRSYTRWHWKTFLQCMKNPRAMSVTTVNLWVSFRNRQRNSKRLFARRSRAREAA
ncbi:MAG TPA: fatty acid desaturase [Candidatus Dormibacteraeota bacterium]